MRGGEYGKERIGERRGEKRGERKSRDDPMCETCVLGDVICGGHPAPHLSDWKGRDQPLSDL